MLRARIVRGDLTVADSNDEHGALIEQLLQTNSRFADDFGLSLDPELATNRLVQAVTYALPSLAEELGKVRA